LAGLVDAGTLRAPELIEMPLAQAAKALELSKQGHVRGKIVLMVD
ncbi:MAG: zinc-binding dehydrogenase, partial [Rhodospirillaceae bacterium]|nr:zinc-binding dehydrogenase [Rhodospirillaceae bacterium]